MKHFIFITVFLSSVFVARAAVVDTVDVRSASMKRTVKTVIIVPDAATGADAAACPVVYLLHGYDGNHRQWITTKPDLPDIADRQGIIFVCPDGRNSWYLDSPVDPSSQYETFISKELPAFVDTAFRTIPDRAHRAITGLSMGGHGALFNAMRHSDVFGAAGSMSGALDVRERGSNRSLIALLGTKEEHPDRWENCTAFNQISKLKPGSLAIIFDCGRDDFCFGMNLDFDRALTEAGIDHDCIFRPGAHNHAYWRNAIDYQALFFSKFFTGK
jgi:S-formylglutathione hydrolase FrmB